MTYDEKRGLLKFLGSRVSRNAPVSRSAQASRAKGQELVLVWCRTAEDAGFIMMFALQPLGRDTFQFIKVVESVRKCSATQWMKRLKQGSMVEKSPGFEKSSHNDRSRARQFHNSINRYGRELLLLGESRHDPDWDPELEDISVEDWDRSHLSADDDGCVILDDLTIESFALGNRSPQPR